MNEKELYPDQSRSLENLLHMRLMALLRDMIDDQGKVKAAKTLSVNCRTLVRAVESEQLTARMSAELECHLLLGGGSAAAQQRESVRVLKERVEVLEERLERGLEDLCGVAEEATAEVREEQAQGMRRLERRLAKAESEWGSEDSSKVRETVEERGVEASWRPYRDMVTAEPEPGEEQVYGDVTPLIVEWRRVSAEFAEAGDTLSRAVAEERLRELEIELIEERKLTLERARVQRARAELRHWLRRVITFGLWQD